MKSTADKVELSGERAEVVDLGPLSSCMCLEELDISNNILKSVDLEPIGKCARLQTLNLSENQLQGIDLTPLSSCRDLQELDLSFNHLQSIDLTPLSCCTSLRSLQLQRNNLQRIDLTPVPSCAMLYDFNLSQNQLQNIDLTPLSSCTVLRQLQLSYNRLQGVDLRPLSSCANLSSFSLDNNPLKSVDASPLVKIDGLSYFNPGTQVRITIDPSLQKRAAAARSILRFIETGRVEFVVSQPRGLVHPAKAAQTGVVAQSPPSASRMGVSLSEEVPSTADIRSGVSAVRGHEIVGSSLHYKVKVINNSDDVITDVTIAIGAYPTNCLQIQGDIVAQFPKIEPRGGFRAKLFVFTPGSDCVEGEIHSTVSYVDHSSRGQSFTVQPEKVRVVCDLLTPLSATLEEFVRLFETMSDTTEERTMQWNGQALFSALERVLPVLNLRIIHSDTKTEGGQFYGITKALARGKYGGKTVALDIKVRGALSGRDCVVTLHAGAENKVVLPSLLGDIVSRLDKLQRSVDQIADKTQKLMTAAEEEASAQRTVLEALKTLQTSTDANALLTRQILDLVTSKLNDVRAGQERTEETIRELVGHIERIAGTMLPEDRTLRDRLVQGVKDKARDITKMKTEQVLWGIAKVALRILTGIPIP